ncbi:hypothetical protein PR048_005902 [Dryococelus australis]|uniref:Uncharacterized protein n=1 Tax=Dryococelus australis TaxID=614101 RepID=A0ABQ9I9K3_9NEOP|nr:hypothetical protein PR048_005902 [Dryococelus australis]
MICVDNQPFSVVENQGFVRMMNVVEPKYKFSIKKHLSKIVLPEMYEKVKVSIERVIRKAQLCCSGQFSQYVCRYEKACFKDVSYLAHTLQLVINYSVFNQKVTFCKSQQTTESSPRNFHIAQKCMIQDEPTRWNSTLHMLKIVLEQRRRCPCHSWPGPNKWDSLHPSQWSLIEAFTEILSLFGSAILAISYQNVNVGDRMPINSFTASLTENYALKGMTNDLLAYLQRSAMPLQQDPHFKIMVFVSNEAVIAAKQYILSKMDKLETSKILALSGEMEI